MDWDEREKRAKMAIRFGDTVRVSGKSGTYKVIAAGSKILHVEDLETKREISVYKKNCVKDLEAAQ